MTDLIYPLKNRAETYALLIQKYMDPYISDYLRSVIVSSLGEDGRKYLKVLGDRAQQIILEEMSVEYREELNRAWQHRLEQVYAPIPTLPKEDKDGFSKKI